MFVVSHATERASMKEASIIGLDLSKRSFQAHGALAMSFQEVVHSVRTVKADVAKPQ
jgi:hypothetical protein